VLQAFDGQHEEVLLKRCLCQEHVAYNKGIYTPQI